MVLLLKQLVQLSCIILLLLQCVDNIVGAFTNFVYQKNGVRLLGVNRTHGRVEVLPRIPWERNDWVQVCDDFHFTDVTAQNLCRMLGYRFGRKYYTTEIAFPLNPNIKAGDLNCFLQSDIGRRLNEEVIMSGDDDLAEDANHHAARQGRKLLAPAWGYINATSKAPFFCQFRVGTCNPAGPVAGLQCAKTLNQLPPAPPPPPSPPNPPPPPPAVANSIRIITDGFPSQDGPLEPNLCSTRDAYVCQRYGRVEIEVGSPDSSTPGKIWAPVCNVADSLLAERVAWLACTQKYQGKARPWLPNLWYINQEVSPIPFYIPNNAGAVRAGDFNPAAVKGYVTITGGDFKSANKLQDLQYQVVSSKPCDQSAMFAFACVLMSNDGAIP